MDRCLTNFGEDLAWRFLLGDGDPIEFSVSSGLVAGIDTLREDQARAYWQDSWFNDDIIFAGDNIEWILTTDGRMTNNNSILMLNLGVELHKVKYVGIFNTYLDDNWEGNEGEETTPELWDGVVAYVRFEKPITIYPQTTHEFGPGSITVTLSGHLTTYAHNILLTQLFVGGELDPTTNLMTGTLAVSNATNRLELGDTHALFDQLSGNVPSRRGNRASIPYGPVSEDIEAYRGEIWVDGDLWLQTRLEYPVRIRSGSTVHFKPQAFVMEVR